MMNKHLQSFLLSLSVLLLCAACGPDDKTARLEGYFENIDHAEFYIYQAGDAFTGIDTIRIEGGKFRYETPLTAPAIFTLQYPNFSRALLILEPGQTVKLAADVEHLSELKVKGTEANERFTALRLKIEKENGKNKHLAAAQYIHDNASKLDAVLAYLSFFDEDNQIAASQKLALLESLKKAMPGQAALTPLLKLREASLRNGVGQRLTAFQAVTLSGKNVRSADYLGKPLLIAVVASWQADSHALLYNLRALHRAYPAAFNSLVLALDVEKPKLMEMLRADSVAQGQTVIQSELFDAPLVRQLGIERVPGTLLVDAQGVIVGRDLTIDELKNWRP